jgi:hypothetical protein
VTLREEVLFRQYGATILKFDFFVKLKNNDLAWNLVKKLKKVLFLAGDIIYADNSASESMYFVQYGDVKLVALN